MPRYVNVPAEAIVIRFRPTERERVLQKAVREHERSGVAALSVFADVCQNNETPVEAGRRLVNVANLPSTNSKFWRTTAGELLDRDFLFLKDEYDLEADEHYSVDLRKASLDNVVRFLEAFGLPEAV